MSRVKSESSAWHFGDRYYSVVMASDVGDRDGIGLELEDVAPAPGRGLVMEVFRDDDSGMSTLRCFTSDPLPLELVERFLAQAQESLTHIAPSN
ncbi:hypothetical protein GCM10022223_15740 [Kineosporia mesophila]|uniref:DUF2283 domain-containing protein n=1 Tax=Kineosporia mesophila TaxID=566012 RepID=A0ABP6Z903_9ACTN|nr:hypothetical protein [Kineosporia mesophila]MCD5353049.1 hypothetical protein [Kineosporia mesophila]